eukprot:scaffold19720_cov35-Cyclotella_meneghiniana.AAC.1
MRANRHKRSRNPMSDRIMYNCEFCPRTFYSSVMARRHTASCRSRVAGNNAGNVAGNARGSDRIMYNCEFCPRTFYSSVMARRHEASCRSRVAGNNAGNVAGNARGSENVLIGSNARRATANVLIESTAQTEVTDTSDDAEENDNLLIGGTRQTAIPVFDNDVSYNLRRATYNDIDRLPVYKVKWTRLWAILREPKYVYRLVMSVAFVMRD